MGMPRPGVVLKIVRDAVRRRVPDLMEWAPDLLRRVVGVSPLITKLDKYQVFLAFTSLLATSTSLLKRGYDSLKSGKGFQYDDALYFLLLSGVVFHLTSIRVHSMRVAVLTDFLLEPLGDYPPESAQQSLVRLYYRKFSFYWLTMGFNVITSALGLILYPLIVIWVSGSCDPKDWPLPLGRVLRLWDHSSVYLFWYLLSIVALLTSCAIHFCWLGTFICSTLLVETKLELLMLELDGLGERVWGFYLENVNAFPRLQEFKFLKERVAFVATKVYLKDLVDAHATILRQVRYLDRTYRWVVLVYVEITMFCTALLISATFYEWSLSTSQDILRLNVLIACLVFCFINNVRGQTITDKFDQLRFKLYCVDWVHQPLIFQRSLLIMMTVSTTSPNLASGNIFKLSLASFKRILEGIYSYASFLIQIKKIA